MTCEETVLRSPRAVRKKKIKGVLGLALGVAALALPANAVAAGSGGIGDGTGSTPTQTTPGSKAKLVGGYAVAPAGAY